MATSEMSKAIQHLRRTALLPDGAGLTDGQLLSHFLEQREEGALAALVRRHGPMVWGVCRRRLSHHDAEDAFQATFLVLVRKAATVRPREMVANWLYGVACMTAHRGKVAAARRRRREMQVGQMPEPAGAEPANWADLRPVLDQELSRLPQRYRSIIVLCDLEGKTRKQAARQLGLPAGTVGSRLARARAMLAKRLARHGLAISAVALAGLLSRQAAAAAVPAAVLSPTIKAVTVAASHAAAGAISPQVAALTEGVLKVMLLNKLKGLVMLLAVGLVGLGIAAITCRVLAAGQAGAANAKVSAQKGDTNVRDAARPAPAASAQGKRRRAGPGHLLLGRRAGLLLVTPAGKQTQEMTAPEGTDLSFFTGRLSPDGSQAAFVVMAGGGPRPPRRVGEEGQPWPFKVIVRRLAAATPTAVIDLPAQQLTLIWAPDGKRVLVTKELGEPAEPSFETVVLDPKTGKIEPFNLPAGVRLLDSAPDGKTFLAIQRQQKKSRLGLIPARGPSQVQELLELHGTHWGPAGCFSPDGTRVLYLDADPADKDASRWWGMNSKPYVLDLATRKSQPLADFPLNGQAVAVAWAPSGKRVAYTWKQVHRELLKKESLSGQDVSLATEGFLTIADQDGRNPRTVASSKSNNAINPIFGLVDWR